MKPVRTGILLIAVATVLSAQNKPTDLSGTWQLNIAKSKPPKFGKNEIKLKPATLVIQCTAITILMRYTSAGKITTQTYTPDGKEQIVSQGQGGETAVKARWKKGVLIIETSGRAYLLNDRPSELMSGIQRWSLSPDGNTLTHEEDSPKSVSIFDRISAEPSATPETN